MIELLVIPVAFVFIQVSSYLVHRSLHRRLHKAHHEHHFVIYSPLRFFSDEYKEPTRGAGRFQAIAYSLPAITGAAGLLLLGWLPAVLFLGTCVVSGKCDQYVHDAVHVKGHWLERFEWFWRRRFLHRQHHLTVDKNYGICWFFVDHLFGSFAEVENRRKRTD